MGTNGRVCLGLNVGGISMIGVFVFQMNNKNKNKIDIFISLVVVLVPVLSCLVLSRLVSLLDSAFPPFFPLSPSLRPHHPSTPLISSKTNSTRIADTNPSFNTLLY